MFSIFKDRTIKKAVGEVLKARIATAQDEFNARHASLKAVREEAIQDAHDSFEVNKAIHAAELANKVLGN